MKVYLRSIYRAVSIFHDAVKIERDTGPKLVAACSVHTWRERADWQVAPSNMTTNCQRCLMLRRLADDPKTSPLV